MTVREIQAFLAELYAVEVSPDLISSVTEAVVTEAAAWQQRPLEAMNPVVFFDASASRFAMRPRCGVRRCTSRSPWGIRFPTVVASRVAAGDPVLRVPARAQNF